MDADNKTLLPPQPLHKRQYFMDTDDKPILPPHPRTRRDTCGDVCMQNIIKSKSGLIHGSENREALEKKNKPSEITGVTPNSSGFNPQLNGNLFHPLRFDVRGSLSQMLIFHWCHRPLELKVKEMNLAYDARFSFPQGIGLSTLNWEQL